MGGTTDPRINDPRNLILLCGSGTTGCHGWVESNRRTAQRLGYLIGSLEEQELDRPIVTLWTTIVLELGGGRHEVSLRVSAQERA